MLKFAVVKQDIDYDGNQLRSHWVYDKFDLLGDAAVAFCGMAMLSAEELVDLGDARDKEGIYSPYMLHFIIEHFDPDLEKTIYRQRLFLHLVMEELGRFEIYPQRIGDRLYVKQAKLTVSTASLTVVSGIIHLGLNIRTEDTPVKAVGLEELGLHDIPAFAERVLVAYQRELESITDARAKVRPLA
ncbi:MAG: DUF366 family protein [Syntrophomonadaceae bacterium]|nr:DUF366 family protein [Syntrophomonadaceae bacterium]